MNPTGEQSQQSHGQSQSGGWIPKKTSSPSRSRSRSAKRISVKRPNPLQNQAQLHKVMSLFQ